MVILLLVTVDRVNLQAGQEASVQPGPATEGPATKVQRDQKAFPAQIKIRGNSSLTSNDLLKAAQDELDQLGRPDLQINAVLDDAAFEMASAYRRAGYAFATVGYRFERRGEIYEITFEVSEGVRCFIQRIELHGFNAFPEEQLLAFFKNGKGMIPGESATPFVETEVNSEIDELRSFYYSRGYQDMIVAPPKFQFSEDRSRVTVVVEIQEGIQYLIRDVEFTGDLREEAKAGLRSLTTEMAGAPYYARQRLLVRSRVSEIYGDLGYLEARVEVSEKEGKDKGDVLLEVTIYSGPRVIIDKIVLPENIKTKPSFIMSRLSLRAGEPFSLERQRQSFRALYRSGLFSKVNLELIKGEDPEKRTLVVHLVELPSRELSFQAGWGSYEQLRLGIGVQEKNFQGKGRRLRAEGLVSLKSEKLELGLTDPRFTGRELQADIPLFYQRREEPGYTSREIGSSVNVSKTLAQGLSSTFRYQYRFTDISETDPALITGTNAPDTNYNLASIRMQITVDRRDDLIFPSKGHKGYLSAELADTLLGSEVNFLRLTAGWRRYYSWRNSNVIGLRYETGFILPMRDEVTLPQAELFYNGGENTVRSFRQDDLGPLSPDGDPLGGLAYNVLSLELRHRFRRNMAISFFIDAGNIAPNNGPVESNGQPISSRSELIDLTWRDYFGDFRSGVGMGFLYLLPVGPARLDLALNPAPDKERNEDRFVLHFSFGMSF